jgi:2'-5' RNA ligase
MADQRLFFALWPSSEVRDELVSRLKDCPSVKGLRHIPADLHMTLIFLGNVKEQQLSCIEQVAQGIDAGGFEMAIDHTGYWPRPRIVWAAPDTIPQALSQLVDELKLGLSGCGFEPEQRPYRPHVTLYRKSHRVVPWRIEPSITWRVDEFVLAGSNNSKPGHSRYRILQCWALRGHA